MTILWFDNDKDGRLIGVIPGSDIIALFFEDIDGSQPVLYHTPVIGFAHIVKGERHNLCPIILADEMSGELKVINARERWDSTFAGILYPDEVIDDEEIKIRLEVLKKVREENKEEDAKLNKLYGSSKLIRWNEDVEKFFKNNNTNFSPDLATEKIKRSFMWASFFENFAKNNPRYIRPGYIATLNTLSLIADGVLIIRYLGNKARQQIREYLDSLT